MTENLHLPGIAEIIAAAKRIRSHAIITPLLESPLLNRQLGGRLLLKPECLQLTGSFKFRGAFNKIRILTEESGAHGFVAFSSGNHAQGVAAASAIAGFPCAIVMPDDAPRIKIERTNALGAQVVPYPRHGADREALANSIVVENGWDLVRPFDDPDVIAGQGTIGYELATACRERSIIPDRVLVPCGGGGLCAGVSTAIKHFHPNCDIHTVEPEGWDDTAQSLASGERITISDTPDSSCDALLARTPGNLTFAINRRFVSSGLTVSESEVRHAMHAAFREFKLVVEPGGAVALAAVLAMKIDIRDQTVLVVVSGGNVDRELYLNLISTTD